MSHDDDLARLLDDAVSGIEPTDRLGELRARTTTTRGTGLRWGVALAAAAAVAVVAGVVSTTTGPGPDRPPVATDPTSNGPTSPGPTSSGRAVAAYFVGETPRGPRLYREFQRVSSPTPGLAGLQLLEQGPLDPDYASEWAEGSFDSLSDPEAGVVQVGLGPGAPSDPSELALQQVAYTVSAGFSERLTVVVRRGSEVVTEVEPLPQVEVLALVSLSDPAEGLEVNGDSLAVEGVANSFEANVPWRVEGTDLAGSFTATGWMGTRLFPFSGEVDVSSLDPGTYTLIVETDDPAGGDEGPGATSDSRTFVVP